MKFNENQVYKQNEVSHWLVPITMIVTIDFRLFSEPKSKKIQNVLFDNCCSRNKFALLWGEAQLCLPKGNL